MSTVTKPLTGVLVPEKRILLQGVGYHVYETLVEALSPHSPIRLAYDGKDLEIMSKSQPHEEFRRLIDRIIMTVAIELVIKIKGLGESTWRRSEIRRGIEADQCYFLTVDKIAKVRDALNRRSMDVADYPDPDLAVEVDISAPEADREGIYAAMRVAELWVFDGEMLLMKQLGSDGQYVDAGQSRWLPIQPDEVTRWLVDEDSSEDAEWERRLRAWVQEELAGRRISAE